MTLSLGCNHAVGKSIQVTAGETELFTYVYEPTDAQLEAPRPYLHPMRTVSGDLVTVFRPHDHVWHKGLAWSLPHFGHDNFWGGRTFSLETGYRQLDNNGSMDHERITQLDVADDVVRFGHELAWHTQAGAHVADEERVLEARLVEDGWVLVYRTTTRNVSPETVQIGSPTTAGRENAGYGGFFWRGPRSFTGGTILAPQGSGGDELRGQKAPWMGFSGKHDSTDRASTVLIVDAGDNPRHPPQWFVRSENFAAVCPAPFFSEELPFEPGATLTFRYAVLIADGASDDDRATALAAQAEKALTV
ncbi:methane monooxygenase PmoA-like [Kribbella amoyensis]|uniref:Methane monooxygenase PmoA-like n=1 Tax=Kribbella amoyensis TaxID=996641 RepID=A0A561BLN4_9ACTN|nr:PmoA family protein [Kribbella amoyensis]TWD79743.1 methane monooxygenase PmoA-like [Kribbella amoyensis]